MNDMFPQSNQYLVGVDAIDGQHKELFRLFNLLGNVIWSGNDQESVSDTIGFLATVTRGNFATEEHFMERYGYPGYREHKQAHDWFVGEVRKFEHHYTSEDVSASLVMEMFNNLADWTKEHVRGMDRELGTFLRVKSSRGTSNH